MPSTISIRLVRLYPCRFKSCLAHHLIMKLPGLPVERITPDVDAVPGEHGRFWVRSRSDTTTHFVDIFANGFVGQCDCPHFRFRIQPDIERGIKPNGSQQCYHVKRARECFIEIQMRAMWSLDNRKAR